MRKSRGGGHGRDFELPEVVDRADWDRLLAAATCLRDRALLAVMLWSGVRVAECCDLDPADIDFRGEKVFVRCGKGRKQRKPYCHPHALDLVRQYLELRPTPKPGAGDPLFVSRNGRRLCTRQAWNIVRQAGLAAGLGDWLHPHALRHSHGTRLYEQSGDLLLVGRQLGHSDSRVTEIYAHVADSRRQNAVRDM